MDKAHFRQRVTREILVLDGAMGTMLQSHLHGGACLEFLNLEKPDLVFQVHTAYVGAGADIILTNTLGASRIKLANFDLSPKVKEINDNAAKIARKAAGKRAWVAGCIGPTGKLIDPMGDLGFEETYDVFREQAVVLAQGGVDLFILETFSDLKEIKIAIMAVRENTDLPIIASMTFDDGFLTYTGTNPETAANVLTSMGVDAIGVNCSTGPEPMLEVVGRYVLMTDLPICVEPNAGIPRLDKQKTLFQISAQDMAVFGEKFVNIGVNMMGSCCGSTPEYTAHIKEKIKGKKPLSRKLSPLLKLSSRVQTVSIGTDYPFCIIGERINPTNRNDLADALHQGKMVPIQKEAQDEVREGAHLLDVNIGVPGIQESVVMDRVVRGIENVVNVPLCIDSVNPEVIEVALQVSCGKVLINSVNGEEKSIEKIIPLARRYGAGLLCLAVGPQGIPKSAEARLAVLKTIVKHAEKAGIPRENLICDCLTLTVSAQQKRAETTLRAIRMVKEELRLPTVLGVSNISYGLPDRSLINATFLSMAMAEGLDAAIMNPGDPMMMETVRAASVLTVRDKDSKAFVETYKKKRKITKKGDAKSLTSAKEDNKISVAVMRGNREEIGVLVKEAIASGKTAQEINSEILIPAIREVGEQYDRKEIYLPQMILAAETMQKAFEVLEPHFRAREAQNAGKVLICTVKGDVHDIGKNIVALFLKNHGFHVIDLGKDVPTDTIIKKTLEHQPDVVGLSALMTTTMVEMPVIIQQLKKRGITARVVVGGAVVTKQFAKEIGADDYAKDGVSAVEKVKAMVDKT